jgi:hypothetical protein
MKYTVDFLAPGTPSDTHGFEQARGALVWTLDGQKLLKALDTSFSDGPTLKQTILAGETLGDATFQKVEKAAYKRVFGPGGDTWARYAGDFHDLFDYKTEMTEAKKAYPQMMIDVGLDKPKEPPAGKKPPADDAEKVPRLKMPDKLPNIPAPILPGL